MVFKPRILAETNLAPKRWIDVYSIASHEGIVNCNDLYIAGNAYFNTHYLGHKL